MMVCVWHYCAVEWRKEKIVNHWGLPSRLNDWDEYTACNRNYSQMPGFTRADLLEMGWKVKSSTIDHQVTYQLVIKWFVSFHSEQTVGLEKEEVDISLERWRRVGRRMERRMRGWEGCMHWEYTKTQVEGKGNLIIWEREKRRDRTSSSSVWSSYFSLLLLLLLLLKEKEASSLSSSSSLFWITIPSFHYGEYRTCRERRKRRREMRMIIQHTTTWVCLACLQYIRLNGSGVWVSWQGIVDSLNGLQKEGFEGREREREEREKRGKGRVRTERKMLREEWREIDIFSLAIVLYFCPSLSNFLFTILLYTMYDIISYWLFTKSRYVTLQG